MSLLVLDASVALRWLFEDGGANGRAYARNVLSGIRDGELSPVCTPIWPVEVSHVVSRAERQGVVSGPRARAFLDGLQALAVDIHPLSQQDVFGAGHELCLLHGLSAYDAPYLQLATQIGAPLATSDGVLREVAGKVGIQVFDT